MKNYFYCTLFLCLFACKNIALHPKTQISEANGMQKITINQPNFSLDYYGDYWFHKLDSRLMYIGNNFIDFVKIPVAMQKPTLFYVGHTTSEPYFNTFCILYANGQTETFTENLLQNLKNSKTTNTTQKSIKIKETDFINISYIWTDAIRKTQTMHQEYITVIENQVVRFIFTTALGNNTTMFEQEINTILGSLQRN